jgi:4-diphosphocytidyl-2-C-methyl-D-erythritol kinase
MSGEVRVTAPAKINLSLGVGSVRSDGYHPLATVYQAVSLFDEVVLRPVEDDSTDVSVTVSGDGVDVDAVPSGEDNLAVRAVRLLGQHVGRELGVALHLRKRIPVAGGLAGGSTDAAAALLGADALFELHLPRPELLELAATLGSDVPFCLTGGTAMGAGRGEQVTPVMTRGEYWWVVVPDPDGLSTSAVYTEYDRLNEGRPVPDPEIPDALLAALRAGDVEALGRALSNGLTGAALSFRPDLAELLRTGTDCSAHGALVSGSGPTTLFLCESPSHAEQVSEALEAIGERTGRRILPPVVVRGPVHGARVTAAHR